MNVNIKQKLAGKSAYIALAVLLIAIIAFTIVAVVAAVNSQEEDMLPSGNEAGNEQNPPSENGGETETGGNVNGGENEGGENGEKPGDTTPEPEKPVYVTPCEGIIQKDFSSDTLVFSQTMNDHRMHLGVDVAGKLGDPVKAFAKGTIEKIYTDPFMGKTVVIDHGNGLKSFYMNLSDTIPDGIKEGTQVAAETVIGAIGETASTECADSPHLHFEIRLNDKKLDPKSYVTFSQKEDSEDVYEG